MNYLSWSKYWSCRTALAFAALLVSCQPELDLPPPPDIQSRLDAYAKPSAEVQPEIMAAVDDVILALHEGVDQSSVYEEVIDVVADVQEEVYNEQDEVDLGGGVTFPAPDGGVTIEYICDGWAEPPPAEQDPGVIDLNMRIADGAIAPLVWGQLDACKYSTEIGDVRVKGGVAAYFGEPLPAGQNVKELPEGEDPAFYTLRVIFVIVGLIFVDESRFPIDNLFEVTLGFDDEGNLVPRATAISFLIELGDGTSFNYSFAADLTQKLEDGVGDLTCRLQDRTCEGASRTFSWE